MAEMTQRQIEEAIARGIRRGQQRGPVYQATRFVFGLVAVILLLALLAVAALAAHVNGFIDLAKVIPL